MKKSSYWMIFIIIIFFFTNCIGQKKMSKIIIPVVDSDLFYTMDSIHYYMRYDSSLVNTKLDVYDIRYINSATAYDTDIVTYPLHTVTNIHGKGEFKNGMRVGKWIYYDKNRKIREEYYDNGRRIRVHTCPCKNK